MLLIAVTIQLFWVMSVEIICILSWGGFLFLTKATQKILFFTVSLCFHAGVCGNNLEVAWIMSVAGAPTLKVFATTYGTFIISSNQCVKDNECRCNSHYVFDKCTTFHLNWIRTFWEKKSFHLYFILIFQEPFWRRLWGVFDQHAE